MASTAYAASPVAAAAPPPPTPSPPGDGGPDPDPDPSPNPEVALLTPAAMAPAALAPAASDSTHLVPPPPDKLQVAPVERVWVEVGSGRRPRQEKVAAPPPGKDVGLPRAFKQRTFGLCFRCLAPDHFVAVCHSEVRCLGCGQSGHRERDCLERHPAGSDPRRRPRAPAEPRQRPFPCSGSPPAPPHRHGRTWASVVAHQASPATDGVTPTADPDVPPAVLGSLHPLLADQAEALSTELHAMFAARLEALFKPLQDLAAVVERWTAQVSSLWEPMEDIGGNQDLAKVESAPLIVADGEDGSAFVVAGCSAELSEMAQSVDDPPALGKGMLEVVLPGVQEQAQDQPGNGMVQMEVALPSSSTKLDEFWSSFKSTTPHSLLDAPIQVQFEADSSCARRRSGRLEKKSKGSNIPVAKPAEYRLAESFGDLPKG
uniref:Uncharacterized protein n=1 Tax=Avena sativa TaxID=4498 RepID=A0ACD5UKC2_AVESA